MKTIVTLDRGNQPFGFPQLDGYLGMTATTISATTYLNIPGAIHWNENTTKTIDSSNTVVISGNYVLDNENLIINTDNTQFASLDLIFEKYGQLYIGGYLLVNDSNIVNNGLISVAGGIIISGASSITGSGIII